MTSPSRRAFVRLSAGAAAAALVPACSHRGDDAPVAAANPGVVRIASLMTAVEGDLLPELVKGFPGKVELTARPDLYDVARAGKVDLVVSHYGHRDAEQYVLDGLQRLMVSIVVKLPGTNIEGARAMQAHLLSPATQAQIRATRCPSDERICWVPAGRHNRTAILPLT